MFEFGLFIDFFVCVRCNERILCLYGFCGGYNWVRLCMTLEKSILLYIKFENISDYLLKTREDYMVL